MAFKIGYIPISLAGLVWDVQWCLLKLDQLASSVDMLLNWHRRWNTYFFADWFIIFCYSGSISIWTKEGLSNSFTSCKTSGTVKVDEENLICIGFLARAGPLWKPTICAALYPELWLLMSDSSWTFRLSESTWKSLSTLIIGGRIAPISSSKKISVSLAKAISASKTLLQSIMICLS